MSVYTFYCALAFYENPIREYFKQVKNIGMFREEFEQMKVDSKFKAGWHLQYLRFHFIKPNPLKVDVDKSTNTGPQQFVNLIKKVSEEAKNKGNSPLRAKENTPEAKT